MKKRFIKGSIIESVIDPENGTTKVDMIWEIDFSKLPYMGILLDFLSLSLNNKDFNDVSRSLVYWDHRHHTFSFTTTASSKVSDKDTYNEDTGYHIALMKNQKKALYTYNRLINVINIKINKYFKRPLEEIKMQNNFDAIVLYNKLDEYKHKQN